MTITVEFALVVGLFVIGAIVLALDNALNASYRWIVRRYKIKPSGAQTTRMPRRRNLHDL